MRDHSRLRARTRVAQAACGHIHRERRARPVSRNEAQPRGELSGVGWSFCRAFGEQARDEVLELERDVQVGVVERRRRLVASRAKLREQCLADKREVPRQNAVRCDAKRIQVGLWARRHSRLDEFGCDVAGRSNE